MNFQVVEVKTRINKKNILNLNKNKKSNPPYPDNIITVGNNQLGYRVKYDLLKHHNKHYKSNSETAQNVFKKEQNHDFVGEDSESIYSKFQLNNKFSPKNQL